MTAELIILLLLGLFTKHLIVDFPMQVPYHYRNKGTYGHLGGIAHAGLHGFGTLLVLAAFSTLATKISFIVAFVISFVDMIVHYHVDWAKMNLNKKLGWGPTTHEQFWWLLGLDQYVHVLTYLGIAWYLA